MMQVTLMILWVVWVLSTAHALLSRPLGGSDRKFSERTGADRASMVVSGVCTLAIALILLTMMTSEIFVLVVVALVSAFVILFSYSRNSEDNDESSYPQVAKVSVVVFFVAMVLIVALSVFGQSL